MRYLFKMLMSNVLYLFGFYFLLNKILKNKNVYIILNYHNFSRYNNFRFKRGDIQECGYQDNFEKQLLFLTKYFNFIYPEDFFAGNWRPGVKVLISFDDGYKDNFEIGLPILKKHNAKAIFFLTTNYIDTLNWLWHDKLRFLISKRIISAKEGEFQLRNMNKGIPVDEEFEKMVNNEFNSFSHMRVMLNSSEIEEIIKSGFRIGAHTHNHSILGFLNPEKQEEEIELSVNAINNYIKSECKYIAYPNGLFNNDTLNIIMKYGVEFGFTTKNGVNKIETPKLEIMRIGVNASDSIPILVIKLVKSLL